MELINLLSTFACTTRFEDLPGEVVEEGKRAVLDYLGVALGGCPHPAVEIVSKTVDELGGLPQATVIGSWRKTSTVNAALLNGMMAHVLDYDDTHLATVLHGTTPVLSAAIPVAEWLGRSGKELIAAYVVGFEVAARIALAVYPDHYDRGWHITATVGTFGAAVSAARLLGLDPKQTAHALGGAAAQAAGLRVMFGSMWKPFQVAKAGANGLLAALLTRRGFTSPDAALEGRTGFGHVLSDCFDPSHATTDLGQRFELLRNGVKPYACGVVIHPSVDAIRRIRTRHVIDAEDIRAIHCRVHPLVLELTGKDKPRTGLEGKFSIYHAVAIAMLEGTARQSQFTDEKVQDPAAVKLRGRVTVAPDPTLRKNQAEVTVQLADGREVVEFVEAATGTEGNKISLDELTEKFRDLARASLPSERVEATIESIMRLEEVSDFGSVLAEMAGPAR